MDNPKEEYIIIFKFAFKIILQLKIISDFNIYYNDKNKISDI